MNELFGMPMSGILVALLALLSLCLLSVAWVAWRRPVIFKMGVRNIPRRRAQTILIVVGLMLSTLIISAALGTGDTLNYSTTKEVYDNLGRVDEVVIYSPDGEGNAATSLSNDIPASSLALVEEALADNDQVDGVLPVLWKSVPVVDTTSGQAEPNVGITGVDPSRLEGFGGIRDLHGNQIDLTALGPNEIVINEAAVEEIDASVGDQITIYYDNQPVQFTVAAIAEESALSGSVDVGGSGMVTTLPRLQEITGLADTISLVAISNDGGVRDSIGHTDAVVAAVTPALAGSSLGIDPIKKDTVGEVEDFAQLFTSLFLMLGMFSIAAGILLIVLIFTMLAAERRSEMGISRAVGTHRRQLVQQFVAEGSGYALLSGLVGAALGVAAAVGIGHAINAIFGDQFNIQPHVEPRSLVVAYCLGVVITFLAVVGSSWKISRLNVVAAIRDIPDIKQNRRNWKSLVWGVLLLLSGGLLTQAGLSGDTAFPFYAGMSLLPLGVALFARFVGAPSRLVFSAVGLWLLALWLMPFDTAESLFGELDGDIEMFFLSGIFMVLGATILLIQNLDVLLAGVGRLGGVFRSKLPAIRTAIAYPGASRGRSGMAIAMFSLIVFSLVMMSTMNKNYDALLLGDEASAGWDVRADAMSANPITDFEATLRQNGIDTGSFTQTGTVTTPNPFASRLRMGGTTEWKSSEVRGMDTSFIESSNLMFGNRAEGYESDEQIINALLTEPNVAIVDSSALSGGGDFGSDDSLFTLAGVTSDDETFPPVTVDVLDPETGEGVPVKVIGVLDSKISTLMGMYANQETIGAIYPAAAMTSFYMTLADDTTSDAVAKQIEANLLSNGVQSTSIQDELEESQRQSAGFLKIVEGFMGLGLIVGIAAVGVISFRSVVERRQQIGVLRAIGFQRGLVSLSFLIETAFLVGVGVISGTSLGIVLARNLTQDDEELAGTAFLIPWQFIGVVMAATVAVALVMAWIPSRQAARIAPAEALRYE